MAVAGLLLRPPPCVAMCTPSPSPFPSSQRRRRRRLTLAQPYCTLGLSFVSGRHHRFLLRRRRRTESKRTSRGMGVYASLFGVGAPEALVIGVVALLVFGPKGLAEPEAAPYTSEELIKVTEEQLAASAAAAWNTQEPPPSQQKEAAATSESNDGAISRGSDGAGAAMSESNRNISEKTETER
uniref:Sec-independent protein translocase protein TatA n=1 Tax=Oryza barthii TaxID=65489 RepID=A0A0D3HNC8_9ORYZ